VASVIASLSVAAKKADTPEALMSADRDFDRTTAEKGIEGWVSFFAEDGMQLTPGGNIRGHQAIREYMGPVLARPGFSLRWKPAFADVGRSGDLGYSTGTYESHSIDAKGNPVVRTGRYVSIWKKQRDESWKVVLDTGVPDAPPREH
jgi:ketosteroid isomerase-like protein